METAVTDNPPSTSPSKTEYNPPIHREPRRDIAAYLASFDELVCNGYDGSAYLFPDPDGTARGLAENYREEFILPVEPARLDLEETKLTDMVKDWRAENKPSASGPGSKPTTEQPPAAHKSRRTRNPLLAYIEAAESSPPAKGTYQQPLLLVSAYLCCVGFKHLEYDGINHIFADPSGNASGAAEDYFNGSHVEAETFGTNLNRLRAIEEREQRKKHHRADGLEGNEENHYCFAHRHMSFEEYGLWIYARSVSTKSKAFFFDGRSVGKQFSGQGKNTAYRVGHSLEAKGWFEVVKPSQRGKGGKYSATEYKPLSHAEWAKNHPNQCPEPVPESGQAVTDEPEPACTGIRTGCDR